MKNLSLTAQLRNTEEKTKDLRNNKIIPAVVYGKGTESMSIQMNYSDFLRLFRISGESHIINLKVGKKEIEVLVHEIQREPVSGDFIHIDFYAITRWELLTTKINLNFVGESAAAKEWALIEEHIKEIEVKCLPKNLVDNFEIDLSKLKEVGDSIRISDLDLWENFEIISNIEDVIVAASKPAKIEVEENIEEVATEDSEWEKEEQK